MVLGFSHSCLKAGALGGRPTHPYPGTQWSRLTCPAEDPYAQTAGIKSGLQDGAPMDGRQEHPYLCRSCCYGNNPPYRSNAWYYPCCGWVDQF